MRQGTQSRIGQWTVRRRGPEDLRRAKALRRLFAAAFGAAFGAEGAPYREQTPSQAYLTRLLGLRPVAVMAACAGGDDAREGALAGGLIAYALERLDQERPEFYLYDLAVAAARRREGAATALLEALRLWAAAEGAWVIFVQADHADPPAIALYERFGRREDVLHFDIPTDRPIAIPSTGPSQ